MPTYTRVTGKTSSKISLGFALRIALAEIFTIATM